MTDPTLCPEHRRYPVQRCYDCRIDAMTSGDLGKFKAWYAKAQADDCDKKFPRRFQSAVADHPDVLAWVEQWNAKPSTCPSLLLCGNVGVGKTWQAYGALRAAVTGPNAAVRYQTRTWHDWQFAEWEVATSADLYAALRPSPGKDSETEMERFRSLELLLIDDLGTAKTSEWVEEITYRVIGGRYDSMRPTIFTTNLPLTQLKAVIGDRIASRLAEICVRVTMTGPDRRRGGQAAA